MSTLADECATVEARVHRRGVPRRDRRGGRGAPRRPGGYRGGAATRRRSSGADATTPTRARSTVDWRSARTCRRARAAVFAETGFTMSGGVAHNKMLAKLALGDSNKPNRQALSSRLAPEMLDSLPMRSVRGLGGKFGERVERLVVEHGGVSDAARTAASGARARVVVRGRIPRVGVGSSPVGRFPTRVRRENGGLSRARPRRGGHRTGRAERSGRCEESVRVQIIRRRHGQTARASMASRALARTRRETHRGSTAIATHAETTQTGVPRPTQNDAPARLESRTRGTTDGDAKQKLRVSQNVANAVARDPAARLFD